MINTLGFYSEWFMVPVWESKGDDRRVKKHNIGHMPQTLQGNWT